MMYVIHLVSGLCKGAFDQAVLDQRYAAWKEKNAKEVITLQSKLISDKESARKSAIEAEVKANKARIEKIAKKNQEAAAKVSESAAESTESSEAAE